MESLKKFVKAVVLAESDAYTMLKKIYDKAKAHALNGMIEADEKSEPLLNTSNLKEVVYYRKVRSKLAGDYASSKINDTPFDIKKHKIGRDHAKLDALRALEIANPSRPKTTRVDRDKALDRLSNRENPEAPKDQFSQEDREAALQRLRDMKK